MDAQTFYIAEYTRIERRISLFKKFPATARHPDLSPFIFSGHSGYYPEFAKKPLMDQGFVRDYRNRVSDSETADILAEG